MRGRRRDRALGALLLACVACTGPGNSPSSSAPPATGTPIGSAPAGISGGCPLTRPVAAERVPRAIISTVDPGNPRPPIRRDFADWYGNDALWVELPPNSTVVKPAGEELSEKFPWVRLVRGELTITGRRLDGSAPPARSSVPGGYGPRGFQASGLAFPTHGCWEITGRIDDRRLSVIVEATRSS